MITSQVNVTGIRDIERRLGAFKSRAPVAMYRAINDSVSKTFTEMKKIPLEEFNVTAQKNVASSLKKHKASKSNLKGAVSANGERLDLYKFRHSLSGALAKAAVMKANSPKKLEKGSKKAFIASMRNGHIGIFERQGLAARRKTRKKGEQSKITKHNESIRELTGLSVPQMLKNKESMDRIKQVAAEYLDERLEHHIEYILSRG